MALRPPTVAALVTILLLLAGTLAFVEWADGPPAGQGAVVTAPLAGFDTSKGPELVGGGAAVEEPTPTGPEDPSAVAPLRGFVVDEDGRALAGESVRLRAIEGSAPPTWQDVRPPPRPSSGLPTIDRLERIVTTDAHGAFEIPPDLARGRGRACLVPRGAHVGGCARWSGSLHRTSLPRIVARKGMTMEGHVVDGRGAPVAGRLIAESHDEFEPYWESEGVEIGPGCTFRIGVPERRAVTFRVESDRGPAWEGLRAAPQPGGGQRITLPTGRGRVQGTVTTAAGDAAAGCAVRLYGRGGLQRHVEVTTTTDRRGRFQLVDLPALAWVRVQAWPAAGPEPLRNVGDLDEGATLDVDLRLSAVRQVRVRVMDARRMPVVGAFVCIQDDGRWGREHAGDAAHACMAVDERGGAVLEHVPLAATWRLRAWAPGWSAAPDQLEGVMVQDVVVQGVGGQGVGGQGVVLPTGGDPGPLEVELRLVACPPVLVHVVDLDGAPVSGATVRWGGWIEGPGLPKDSVLYRLPLPQAHSDARGDATLCGWPPGTEARVEAQHAELASAVHRHVVRDDDPAVITIRLLPPCFVEGVLVDAEDRPLAGWVVNAWNDGSDDSNARTGDEGHFRLGPFGEGTIEVEPDIPYGVRAFVGAAPCSLPSQPGHTLRDVRLVVNGLSYITGWVEGTDGMPIEGCTVVAFGEDAARGKLEECTTDDDGEFLLLAQDVPEEVLLVAAGVAPTRVARGTRGVRLVQDIVRRILTLEVRGPEGDPVSAADVTVKLVLQGQEQIVASAKVEDGRALIDLPEVAGAQVHIDISGAHDGSGAPLNVLPLHVRTPQAHAAPLVVALPVGGELRGRVLDLEGQTVPGLDVLARGEAGSGRRTTTRSDEDGHFHFVGLGASLHEITPHVMYAGPAGWSGRVVAHPGERDVVLVVGHPRSLEGTVRSTLGALLPGVVVQVGRLTAEGTFQALRHARTDARGTFQFKYTLPPEGALHVQVPDAIVAETAYWPLVGFEVKDTSAPLDLRLDPAALVEGSVRLRDLDPELLVVVARAVEGEEDGAAPRQLPRAYPDKAGRFRLGPLHPGPVLLGVQHVRLDVGGPSVRIAAPARDVVLEAPPGSMIRGRVPGAPEYTAIQFTAGTTSLRTSINEDGTFAVPALPSMPGTLFVHEPESGRCAVREGVIEGGGPYELVLVDGGTIRGRLEGFPREAPPPRVWIEARGPLGAIDGTVDLHEGTFELRALPSGSTWEIEVTIGSTPELVLVAQGVAAGATDVMLRPR